MMNIKKAIQDFLKANMDILVGAGNKSIGIYKEEFPTDRTATGIVAQQVARVPMKDIRKLEDVSFDFIVFAPKESTADLLCNNLDVLLDQLINIDFNDEVNCMFGERISGSENWIGAMKITTHYLKVNYEFRVREKNNG